MVQTASLLGIQALGQEFGSADQLRKRLGGVWNCLWGLALLRSVKLNKFLSLRNIISIQMFVCLCMPTCILHDKTQQLPTRKWNLVDPSRPPHITQFSCWEMSSHVMSCGGH